MRSYLFAFVLAAVCTWLLTPLAVRAGKRLGAVDRNTGIPRAGGIAIVSGSLLALALLGSAFVPTRNLLALGRLQLGAALLGALCVFLLGVLDDRKALKAGPKFAFEIAIAVVLYFAGSGIRTLWLPGGIVGLGQVASLLLTVVWIVGITNAFNLLDGIDGAAAGAAVFALLAMFATSVSLGQPLVALLVVTMAGAALGFLPFNFPPARVYLGDAGSLTLGFALAVLSIAGATKGPTIVAIAIPLVAFGVPVLDTLFAVIRRAVRGAPLFQGDREHLHHRLLGLGISGAQAAGVLYGVCAVFALASMLLLNPNIRGTAVVLAMIAIVVWLAVRYLRLHEVYELARLASRGMQQTRAISSNVRLRRAADDLEKAVSWDAILKILAELFAASEFDGVRLILQPPGLQRREYRLESGELREAKVSIQQDEWGVHLPFTVGPTATLHGELAVFRRYGRRHLLTDVNLIVEVLRPALAKAAGRVAPPAMV